MAESRQSLQVYDPSGIVDTTLRHAPRLDTLAGKTICELSNGAWEYDRIFPTIREALQKQFPTARIIPYSEVIGDRRKLEDLDHVTRVVAEKGCQAVIAGIAA